MRFFRDGGTGSCLCLVQHCQKHEPEGSWSFCIKDAGVRCRWEVRRQVRQSGNREMDIALGLDGGKPNGVAWRCRGHVSRPFENFTLVLVNPVVAVNAFTFERTILFQTD